MGLSIKMICYKRESSMSLIYVWVFNCANNAVNYTKIIIFAVGLLLVFPFGKLHIIMGIFNCTSNAQHTQC